MKLFLCEIVFFKNNFHNKAKKVCIKTRSPSASLPSITVKWHISGLKRTLPTPWYGQYLTHAHNHITRAVAAMGSCFALIGAHQHGSRRVKDPLLARRVQSAILAYMAGIWSEREGEFFFSPQYPLPFMHLPSKLHPMEGNPDSGMRKIFACGIRNPENFTCEIRNPGFWSPEYSLRNPLTIKIQNPSSSDRD